MSNAEWPSASKSAYSAGLERRIICPCFEPPQRSVSQRGWIRCGLVLQGGCSLYYSTLITAQPWYIYPSLDYRVKLFHPYIIFTVSAYLLTLSLLDRFHCQPIIHSIVLMQNSQLQTISNWLIGWRGGLSNQFLIIHLAIVVCFIKFGKWNCCW